MWQNGKVIKWKEKCYELIAAPYSYISLNKWLSTNFSFYIAQLSNMKLDFIDNNDYLHAKSTL